MMLAFAVRNSKEILRDPINLGFGIGFPLVLLFLLSAIAANAPLDLFQIENLAPGIAVFGLSFISLFSGMLLAKDRTNSFLMRLFTSPLTAADFIFGYLLPFLPMAMVQSCICFAAAIFLGLPLNINILLALIVLLPTALVFTAIGLLSGSLLTDKQVGGICGALLTNVSAWLSGIWFEPSLLGEAVETLAHGLPFLHAVEATRAAVAGDVSSITPHIFYVLAYGVVIMFGAILAFKGKMTGQSS